MNAPTVPTTTCETGIPTVSARAKGFAFASVVVGVLGVIPLLFFFIAIAETRSINLGTVVFLFLGLVVHGLGAASGLTALLMGAKKVGILGMIVNCVIGMGAVLVFLVGLA